MSNALLATLYRSAVNMKAVKEVPEGVCKRCDGTGGGEAFADLGEAYSRGAQLPIKECKSCRGTGMSAARVEVSALGRLLLFPTAAAAYENKRRRTLPSMPAAPVFAGPQTEELLSLMGALGSHSSVAPQKPGLNAPVPAPVETDATLQRRR